MEERSLGAHATADSGHAIESHIDRELERHFFRTHPDLEQELVGQWVALDGNYLVAHGEDLADVIEQARVAGHPHPYLTRVADPTITFIF